MAEYLRIECGDLNEVASDNDVDKDDDNDDANSKDVDSCRLERQIREDKGAEQKEMPYQWLFHVRIKFVL